MLVHLSTGCAKLVQVPYLTHLTQAVVAPDSIDNDKPVQMLH